MAAEDLIHATADLGGCIMASDDIINPDGFTYEQTLGELLSMTGCHVKVTILGMVPLGHVAQFEGTLRTVRDIRPRQRADEGEALQLSFEDGPGVVTVEPRMFSHAGYFSQGANDGVLAVTLGTTVCWLDARDDA